jgi:general secretion pathway protein G
MRATRKSRRAGFTLLELMTATIVVALLVSIAVPTYFARVDRLKVDQAKRELLELAAAIERYRTVNSFRLPDSLADLKNVPTLDPWNNAYQYLNFDSDDPGVKGKIRKDHNLHPLNSEFDLYSMGADGDSAAPLTSKKSQDDVLWARDGTFVGLGSDF